MRFFSRNSLSSTFTSSAETLNGTVTKALSTCVKDNSTIYLEPVPSQATLKDVPGAGMVKAVPFVAGGHAGAGLVCSLYFVCSFFLFMLLWVWMLLMGGEEGGGGAVYERTCVFFCGHD